MLLPAFLVGIPVIVVALYYSFFTGTDEQQQITATTTAQPHVKEVKLDPIISTATQTGARVAPVDELATRLEKRLAANPDDADGWLLLAKSWQHLHETEKARTAYRKARQHGASDADLERQLARAGS